VIITSLGVWSVVTWWTGHAHSYGELLLARACMGVSEACYIPAGLALISDYHRGPTRSLATGLHMSGVFAGSALGGLGGYIAERSNWRLGFTLFGSIGTGYAILMLLVLRDAPGTGKNSAAAGTFPPVLRLWDTLVALGRSRAFQVLFVINALIGAANWSINGWLPTYLREHFSLGLGNAGFSATGYNQLGALAGVLLGGWWADRWARSNPRGRALVPAIGYVVAGPCLFLAALTHTLPAALLGLVVFGLGRGFFDANHMPILRGVADERISATGYGVLNCISCLAGGAMIYAGGWMQDVHVDLSRVFQLSALSLCAAGLLLFAIKLRPAHVNAGGDGP
jgi:MFS family permease